MPYRFLPEIVDALVVMPVQITKHAFYDRLFEVAFMRVFQAGALEIIQKMMKKYSLGLALDTNINEKMVKSRFLFVL